MRKVTKERATFSLDKELLKELSFLCKRIGMSKSGFIESLIRESLSNVDKLFSSEDTLATSLVILSKQLEEIKEVMATPSYQEFQKKVEVENARRLHQDSDKQ